MGILRMRSREEILLRQEEILLRQIDKLRDVAKERKDIFYYEALGQIRELIVIKNHEDLHKIPCDN